MSRAYDFIKECGNFFVLTINDKFPAGRPFGAIMEHEGYLFITTSSKKSVYRELKEHKEMMLLALKPGTRLWVRIKGEAEEIYDISLKQKMLDSCPNLRKFHERADEEDFRVFKIKVLDTEFK